MYKLVVFVCAQALIQSITAQYIRSYTAGCGRAPCETIGTYDAAWNIPFGDGYGPASLAASNGAELAVTSSSAVAPSGVSMSSDNVYDGPLSVNGAIPFLGAVRLEGPVATRGGAEVTYGCGNGNVAMYSEDVAPTYGYSGIAYEGIPASYGYPGNYGYPGCGCAGARY